MSAPITAGAAGFWSYAHADDAGEQGRIVELAHSLQEEYALLTGHDLHLFLDRDDLAWGDRWRDSIEEALAGITFFIPIVTPRYFRSEECRRELLTFARRARSAGVGELLLPILYTDVPGLDASADDEALSAVAGVQWEDWRELRLEDRESRAHRQGVYRLARRLVQIAGEVASKPVVGEETDEDPSRRLAEASEAIGAQGRDLGGEQQHAPDGRDDPPGILDLLAEAEEALPRWTKTIEEIAEVLQTIGQLAEETTAQVERSDATGKGFAGRLSAARRFAGVLEEPADRLLVLGSSYASDLMAVDAGFLTLIDFISEGLESEEDIQTAEELASTIRGMYAASSETVEQLREFLKSTEVAVGFSRELRPQLLKIQDAVRRVVDGQAVIGEWVARLDKADFGGTGAGT